MSDPASRFLKLLSLLQAQRQWPARRLAERLSVSERTLRRDIEKLRAMGYQIVTIKGPDGGYRLEPGSELPPLLFDDEQVIAVAVALNLANVSGIDIGEAAGRALATIRQTVPSRLRYRIDNLNFEALQSGIGISVDPKILTAVLGAISANHVIRFRFNERTREVEPHHVVAHNRRWYLVAWDLEREDWRFFRLDRISPRVPTGPVFDPRTVPGENVSKFIAARFKGSPEEDAWPCIGTTTLDLPAGDIEPFVDDGAVEYLDQDRCRVTLGSWSWNALASRFGSFNAPISEVSPEELANAFAVLARRFQSIH